MTTLGEHVAKERREHGEVRLPWEAFPGIHPMDIHWRMGAGEHQVMMLGYVVGQLDPEERVERVRRAAAVPADWVWWVADYLELYVDDPDRDAGLAGPTQLRRVRSADHSGRDANFGAYDHGFEDVRDKLVSLGLVVSGTPTDEPS